MSTNTLNTNIPFCFGLLPDMSASVARMFENDFGRLLIPLREVMQYNPNPRKSPTSSPTFMFSWLQALTARPVLPATHTTRYLIYGIVIGFTLSFTSTSVTQYFRDRRRKRIESLSEPRPIEIRSDEVVDGVTGLIGTKTVLALS